MNNSIITNSWLPKRRWSAQNNQICDQEYFDFDEQAERLSTHAQEYLQLTEGPFCGRFISCFLGPDTSIHIEHANQALAQSIKASANTYAIGVVLSAQEPYRANGVEVEMDSIFVVPPNVSFHLASPRNGIIMACVVSKEVLENKFAIAPHIQDWLENLGPDIACLRAQNIARRARQDAFNAMKHCQRGAHAGVQPSVLGDALINSLSASVMLEWESSIEQTLSGQSRSFDRFIHIKTSLENRLVDTPSLQEISQQSGMSKRSIQYAFANEVSIGVSGYARHARLHAIRRQLRHADLKTNTIGDIAAEHGFWSWSHFSQQYRQLFGERPSDLRNPAPK